MVKRTLTIPLIAWMLLTGLCHAQSDSIGNELLSRLSTGMAVGPSLPIGKRGIAPGDPIYRFDSTAVRPAMALFLTYRISSGLGIELALDMPIDAGERHRELQRQQAELAFPGYEVLSSFVSEGNLMFPSLGLSYRIELGDFMLEPALLASYAGVEPASANFLLKKNGENEYIGVRHDAGGGNAFALVPVLTFRYGFPDTASGWGLLLRAAYFRTSFSTPYSTTLTTLTTPSQSTSFTTHHHIHSLHIGLGAYLTGKR